MPIPRIRLLKPRILPETLPKGAPAVGNYPKRTPYFSGKTPGHLAYIPGEESSGQTLLFLLRHLSTFQLGPLLLGL